MNPAACVQASKCLPLTFFFVYRILRDIVMTITTVATFFYTANENGTATYRK